MTHASAFSIFLLAIIAVATGASNNRPQAPVQSQAVAQNPTALGTSGQVSGHIYRADTGAPIEGAMIFLVLMRTKMQLVRSNKDGSYIFPDVAAGNYRLITYQEGFIGPAESFGRGPGDQIVVAEGQTVGADVRLTPNPSVATLPLEAIAATYPDHGIWLADTQNVGAQARFSPDGQILAVVTSDGAYCPCELWLYDMRSHQSVPAILPGRLNTRISENTPSYIEAHRLRDAVVIVPDYRSDFAFTWSSDDTLYAEVGDQAIGNYSNTKVVATLAGAKEVEQLPPEIESVLQQEVERRGGSPTLVGRNDQFVVTLEGAQLMMARADGTNTHEIDELSTACSICAPALPLFDTENSLVVYSFAGQLGGGIIHAFNLITGKGQFLRLPYGAGLRLLDRTKAGVVAYSVTGPCVPDDSFVQAFVDASAGILTAVNAVRSQNLCFIKFP